MRLSCMTGKHAPRPLVAANQGFQFSRCRGCGRDMVRSRASGPDSGRGAWRTVPKGFRVVWKPKPAPPASPARIEWPIARFVPAAKAGPRGSMLLTMQRLARRSAGRLAFWRHLFAARPHSLPAVLRLPAP